MANPNNSGGDDFQENEVDTSQLDSAPEIQQVTEPMGLAANEDPAAEYSLDTPEEDLENDPSSPISAGMEVGDNANTVDEQLVREEKQRIAPNVVETVSELDQEQGRLNNAYGGEAVTLAQKTLYDAEQSGSAGALYSGTIESAVRDQEEALLREREKRRSQFALALMNEGLSQDLAEFLADFEELKDDFAEVVDEYDKAIAEAEDALGSLKSEMDALDQEHAEMQSEFDANSDRINDLDDQISAIDDQLPDDLEAKLASGEINPEDLTEEQQRLLQEKWALESERDQLKDRNDVLKAEMDQNRAIHDVYSQNAEKIGAKISDAKQSMAESKARLAELDEQIKQARASGASEEEIQALKDQKAQVEEQLAQTKQKVEDLKGQVETTKKIASFEFETNVAEVEDETGTCLSPLGQRQAIEARTELIKSFGTLSADGDLSTEDLKKLHELAKGAHISQEDLKSLVEIYTNEDSGMTFDGKSGSEAAAAMSTAWHKLDEMEDAARTDLAGKQEVHKETVMAAQAEQLETKEVVADATTAIGGMAEYTSIQEYMLENYSVTGGPTTESIMSVMNDESRYLRSDEGNLVYVSNEDQRMYTLGEDENGAVAQNWLSHEETAELQRQVVEDGMIPRNYAFDTDVAMGMVVDVPEEYSPFDTWQVTYDASSNEATIPARAQVLNESIAVQKAEQAVADASQAKAASDMAQSEQRLSDVQAAKLLVEQNPSLSEDEALVQVQAERAQQELATAIEGEGDKAASDEQEWDESQANTMNTPDPELVAAAGAIVNQVEGGEITASRLNDVLSEFNLTEEQIATLKTAIDNDPNVTLKDDIQMVATADVASELETTAPLMEGASIIQVGINFITERLPITPSTYTPDANGVEASTLTLGSILDEYPGPSDATYMQPVQSNTDGMEGMMAKATTPSFDPTQQKVAVTTGGTGSGGQAGDEITPDESLLMDQEGNRPTGAPMGGGGIAG